MRFAILSFLLALPAIAFACEGACIQNTTDKYVELYERPFITVLQASEYHLASRANLPRSHDGLDYFQPFLNAYRKDAHALLEKAIFPGYFHGKCQRNGIEPKGCPNPDCPVVCGTPGSMVHFYAKLIEIAGKTIQSILHSYCDPSSEPYKQVAKRVEAAFPSSSSSERARALRFSRSTFYPSSEMTPSTSGFLKRHSSSNSEHAALEDTMDRMPGWLEVTCNGKDQPEGEMSRYCSWESQMKAYILTFP